MKELPILIFLLATITTTIGCSRAPRHNSQLVLADSLMSFSPDSALTIIKTLDYDTLTNEEDRAYYNLILTQARYKCYLDITAQDDSVISHAVEYYRHHNHMREKLVRAFLYKGAVMEELHHPDSAMFYYKTAETIVYEKDYPNLGQINTRIGNLYRLYYADKQICYDKYKQALSCYKRTGNKQLQLACLLNMGICSGVIHNDDFTQLINQAEQLAIELNDSATYYLCQELLCRNLYYHDHSLDKAKLIAFNCLHNYRRYVNNSLFIDLADIYAYYGMPDSARYYLNFLTDNDNQNSNNEVRTRKYLTLSRITRIEGDTALSDHFDMLGHQLSDSLLNNKQKYQIQKIEDTFNRNHNKAVLSNISQLQWMTFIISFCALVAIVCLTIAYLNRLHKTKAIIMELQHTDINSHESLLEQIDVKDSVIGRFVKNLVNFMQQTIETTENDSPSVIRKHIKKYIGDITDNDFWNELQAHIDRNHNNLLSNIAKHRRITPSDLHFIALSCCGFDYVEIAIVMDYTPKYISQKRKDIARKLHLRIPLQEYLNNAMKQQ